LKYTYVVVQYGLRWRPCERQNIPQLFGKCGGSVNHGRNNPPQSFQAHSTTFGSFECGELQIYISGDDVLGEKVLELFRPQLKYRYTSISCQRLDL